MSKTNICNCGDPVRYSHVVNGETVGSCNKYQVCRPYLDILELMYIYKKRAMMFEKCLNDIVRINAMDYEYKAWAKSVLESA